MPRRRGPAGTSVRALPRVTSSAMRTWRTIALSVTALAAAAAPYGALASEAGAKPGMPQLDPSTFASQVFWLALTFLVFLAVVWRVALPRVAMVLEERQRRLSDDLDKAAALKEEADTVLAEYEKAAAEGRAKAQASLAKAAESMSAEAAKQHGELGEKLSAEIKAAETRIVTARREAADNIRAVASEVAQTATERLIGARVGDDAALAAVRETAED